MLVTRTLLGYIFSHFLILADSSFYMNETLKGTDCLQKSFDGIFIWLDKVSRRREVKNSWSFRKSLVLLTKNMSLKLGETILNHVTYYNYLGLTISASGQFNTAIKDLTDKARRAFYSIRRPLIKFNPPIKLWLKIFDSIIKPILLYGCEIWGLNLN